MLIKLEDLKDRALDFATARAEEVRAHLAPGRWTDRVIDGRFFPSRSGDQTILIIQRNGISLKAPKPGESTWEATIFVDAYDDYIVQLGDSAIQAALRCHVFRWLGDRIELPEQILN